MTDQERIAKLEEVNKELADSVMAILKIHADWSAAKFRGETAMQFISGFIPAIQKART
jgi:hypothetical protein